MRNCAQAAIPSRPRTRRWPLPAWRWCCPGLTVIASVTGIYLINTPVLQSMATGAILAVAVAVLTSTTLTPAVLATFGRAAAKRSSYLHWSRRAETTQSRFWSRWTGWVMRRPWLSALAAVGVTADAGRAGILDGAGQQHAAPVRPDARDPRRRQRGGRGPGPRGAGAGACAGDVPRRQRGLGTGEGACARHRAPADGAGAQCGVGVAAGVRRRLSPCAAVGRALGRSGRHGRPRNRRLDARATAAAFPAPTCASMWVGRRR